MATLLSKWVAWLPDLEENSINFTLIQMHYMSIYHNHLTTLNVCLSACTSLSIAVASWRKGRIWGRGEWFERGAIGARRVGWFDYYESMQCRLWTRINSCDWSDIGQCCGFELNGCGAGAGWAPPPFVPSDRCTMGTDRGDCWTINFTFIFNRSSSLSRLVSTSSQRLILENTSWNNVNIFFLCRHFSRGKNRWARAFGNWRPCLQTKLDGVFRCCLYSLRCDFYCMVITTYLIEESRGITINVPKPHFGF